MGVYDNQLEGSLPGLIKEVIEDLNKIGIPDLKDVSKAVWKKKVRSYVYNKQREELLHDMTRYKKLKPEELANEKFERKEYFHKLDLENARLRFKINSEVIPTVRSQFRNK